MDEGHVLTEMHWVRVPGLFNYNFNQDVAGQAIACLEGIPISHHVACSYAGRNPYLQSFPPSLQYLLHPLQSLFLANCKLIMSFLGSASLAEYFIQIDFLPRPDFKSHSPRPATEASKRERRTSALQEIAKYVVKEIKSQASPAEVLHHFLESGCSERTAEDVAYITDSAKLVVLLSFLRVTKDSVSLVYLLEFLISPFLCPGIAIGMVLHGQFPVGLLNLCIRGVTGYA